MQGAGDRYDGVGGWTYVRVYGDANGPFAFAPWRDGGTAGRGRSERGTNADGAREGRTRTGTEGGSGGRRAGGQSTGFDNREERRRRRSTAATRR